MNEAAEMDDGVNRERDGGGWKRDDDNDDDDSADDAVDEETRRGLQERETARPNRPNMVMEGEGENHGEERMRRDEDHV